MATAPKWRGRHGTPPAKIGQMIAPKPRDDRYEYPTWKDGVARKVVMVRYDQFYDYWFYMVEGRSTKYNPNNFITVEDPDVAYEKTKYFAAKLDRTQTTDPEHGLCLEDICGGFTTTKMRDTASAVKRDVEEILQEGDRWIILQTHSLLEAMPPRPPLRVTEYK